MSYLGNDAAPSRPLLRYHGGKWKLAKWIISNFPEHRVYVEPYGGAASVLLRKERSYAEIYNDLDDEVVNLFKVLRESPGLLREALAMTPYSRAEYYSAFLESEEPLERARRLVVRSYMGFGSNSIQRTVRSGFRSNSNRSGTTPARDWHHFPDCLPLIIERLRGVVIENRDALKVMRDYDGGGTLHYCDPPYVHETRTAYGGHGARKGYKHEMSDEQHIEMAAALSRLKGKVIVNGYDCPLYREIFSGWHCSRKFAFADGAKERTEILWMNFVPAVSPELGISYE